MLLDYIWWCLARSTPVGGLLTDPSNAGPEWQARLFKRKQGIGGGLSTPGACSLSLSA